MGQQLVAVAGAVIDKRRLDGRERQRRRRWWAIAAPRQRHRAADIRQRPGEVELECQRSVNPPRRGGGGLDQGVGGDPEPDPERAQLDLAMELHAGAELKRRPLDRAHRRHVRVYRGA